MTPEPDSTLTFPVPGDTEVLPVPETETLEALPAQATFAGTSDAGIMEPERPFPFIAIGDALISSVPGFDTLPCGHCGTVFDGATPDVLTVTRPLGVLRHLAYEAGWEYDLSLIWTCPECQAAALASRAEGDALLAGGTYPSILREFDIEARATMTAGGRYPWDYDEWRSKFRPRPARCEPESESEADGQAAA